MDSGSDSSGPGLAEDEGAGLEESGVIILLGDSEAGGKIVRADEDTVETLLGENLINPVHGGHTFDVGEENMIRVMVLDVGLEFGFKFLSIKGPARPFPLEWTQFTCAYHGADHLRIFHIGNNDSRGTVVEGDGRVIRILGRYPDKGRNPHGGVCAAHP